jgi:hypothetical protein
MCISFSPPSSDMVTATIRRSGGPDEYVAHLLYMPLPARMGGHGLSMRLPQAPSRAAFSEGDVLVAVVIKPNVHHLEVGDRCPKKSLPFVATLIGLILRSDITGWQRWGWRGGCQESQHIPCKGGAGVLEGPNQTDGRRRRTRIRTSIWGGMKFRGWISH